MLYQKTERDTAGRQKVTYHNRLTVVVVLDPAASIKYPIGYAIGDHESPALIKEALRNAAKHTRELFGSYHKPLQLQSDRYAIKALTPLYEAMTKHFTPARVKNSKSKVVEPYFLALNKQCQLNYSNWSGFGVTAKKSNQPNEDYLNKIRHQFPDEAGCRQQIVQLIESERARKVDRYMERFEALPKADRLQMTTAEYLYLFGQIHSHTNKLTGTGFTPTLMGEAYAYDTFDQQFRELAYIDWATIYDPEDMRNVLVVNAKCDHNSKVKEIIGTYRFQLELKHEQPMALYDRKDGDAGKLAAISQYNKQLEASVVDRMNSTQNVLAEVFANNPQLNNTLTKMVICDSNGQHKDQRNAAKKSKALPDVKSIEDTDYETIEEDVRGKY